MVRQPGNIADFGRGADGNGAAGQLGSLFGYQEYEVEPDVMTLHIQNSFSILGYCNRVDAGPASPEPARISASALR